MLKHSLSLVKLADELDDKGLYKALSLVKLADELDDKGLYKEADGITNILSKFLINQNKTRK
jgi:hypothetical protein